jgi:hypothetical protein
VAGSIGHGGDAERSLLRRAWLRDPDAADRGGGAVEGQGLCQGEALGGVGACGLCGQRDDEWLGTCAFAASTPAAGCGSRGACSIHPAIA